MENANLLDPRNQSPAEFFKLCIEIGVNERNSRRWLGRVIGQGEYDPLLWSKASIIPKSLLEDYRGDTLESLKLEDVTTSTKDGFRKLLFRTADSLPLETVLIPLHKKGMLTVCLSSQVGCVMACTFCATGRMAERRSLETWEIVDQLVQARKIATACGQQISGVVFMGMGEPFLNYDRVIAAAELISFPVINAISAKAITISTVGVLSKINRFTEEDHPYRLSISLGAATDEKRAKLVPVAARTPISKVLAAARRHAEKRQDRIMLSYVCISGENVSAEDAKALGDLIQDTPVRLDLIEVTDSTGRYQPPSQQEFSDFRDALSRYVKHPIVRRYSGGADIQAACGTLAGRA
ncbi:MAG: radical SAM protein [Bdellovibrionota bacterium]